MDTTRLAVLAAFAREGSVTAAADALHYSQPSVSHHLARLEQEVGVPLTVRAGRGLRLTAAGEVLAGRAVEILGRIAAAHDEVTAHAGLRTGRVRVAAFPSALATLVPAAAARFAELHPDVVVDLTEAEPPGALRALRAGDIEVALTFRHRAERVVEFHDVTERRLLDEPLYAVTPRRRRWAGARNDLATYRDERWIAGCERCRAHLLASCERAGFAPSVAFETDDFVATQALVAAGLGVSTLPGLALVAQRHAGVRLDRIPRDGRRVQVATYGGPKLPVTTAAFLGVLREVTRTPPAWPRGG